MSYRKPNTGNSMNDYFTSLMDFNLLSPKLLEAKTDQEFDAWLDKLAQIDRRSTVLFIRAHAEDIGEKFMRRVPVRLGRAWDRQEGL